MKVTTGQVKANLDLYKYSNLDLTKTSALLKKGGSKNGKMEEEALKKACRGVEAMFLNLMLKEMRKTIPKGGLFPDSLQRDIYTSLFDQQICQEATKTRSAIGISDMLFEYHTR